MKMTLSLYISCNIREEVEEGNRQFALHDFEHRMQLEFQEFSKHLKEQGYDPLFRIASRITIP